MRLDGKLLAYHTDVTVFRNVGSIRIYKKSKKIIVKANHALTASVYCRDY